MMTDVGSLPAAWAVCTIADLVSTNIVQRPPDGDGVFIYVDISSIDNESKQITDPKSLRPSEAPTRARQQIQLGDVLVSMTRPNLNAVAFVPPSIGGAVASTGFCVLRANSIEAHWLFYFVQTEQFVRGMTALVQGVMYPAVRPKDILSYEIPIAPVPEQDRVVGEIEKHFTRLDAAVAALERTRTNLKRYRAAVLRAACEGRLVPTEAAIAEAEGREYDAADTLLARILAERRAKWEENQLAKMEGAGKSPKDDKWKTKYVEPATPETDDLPSLPEGWVWASVEQLAAGEPNAITDGPFGSNLKTSHYTESGPRVIRLQNIGDGEFIDAKAHISPEHFVSLKKYEARAGDLVIAGLGSTPPRACLVPPSLGPAIVKADCIKFTVNSGAALPKYLNLTLNAQPTRMRVAPQLHGVGRPRLNSREIKEIVLPLPPLREQDRIAQEAERQLSVINDSERFVERCLARSERLRHAILKLAFEGRLVPQNPNDEPASALLERIRAEPMDLPAGRAASRPAEPRATASQIQMGGPRG